MIYRECFHVEGSLYSSCDTLYYCEFGFNMRVFERKKKPGDRKAYLSNRRWLYRCRDKLLHYAATLELKGFSVKINYVKGVKKFVSTEDRK